jgi:phage protein D
MEARRAFLTVEYMGVDITKDIAIDLIDFKYTDNASDTADDIEITLKDEKAKWLNDWFPEKGDTIKVIINTLNWNKNGDSGSLYCGSFIIDEPEYSGRPRKMTLKGISTPSNTNFTSTKKSRAWENIKLSAIAQNIADSAGLDLFFDAPSDPLYSRKDQSEASDMSFLADLCKKEGFGFKVTDTKIVVFDESKYESEATIITLSEESGLVNSYSFKTTLTNSSYAGCRVKYKNAKNGETIDYLYSIKDLEENDKVYEVNTIVNSYDEAVRLAQKTLRSLNKKECTATFNVVGDLRYVGAVCVQLDNFGGFSGKYFVDKASHSIPNYNVDLELHKVLEGY